MLVRCARDYDAIRAADEVRRSITELCVKEYRNDPLVLARWLASKTVEDLSRGIGRGGSRSSARISPFDSTDPSAME